MAACTAAPKATASLGLMDLLGSLSGEDGCLHCGTKSNCFVGVDGLVGLLAIEELLDHGLDLWDSRGSPDQHHLMHIALVDATVLQALFHGTHRIPEVVHVELLEASSREGARIVDSLEQAVYFDRGLCRRRQSALRTLALRPQTPDRTLVPRHVLATILTLEVLQAEIDDPVVEILPTEMGISSSGLDLENPIFDGQQRNIESTTSHVINQDIPLSTALLVQAVRNCCGCWLVDDAQDIHPRDRASILGGLTLGIVEVGGHSDDCVVDFASQVRLCGLLHLEQDH